MHLESAISLAPLLSFSHICPLRFPNPWSFHEKLMETDSSPTLCIGISKCVSGQKWPPRGPARQISGQSRSCTVGCKCPQEGCMLEKVTASSKGRKETMMRRGTSGSIVRLSFFSSFEYFDVIFAKSFLNMSFSCFTFCAGRTTM